MLAALVVGLVVIVGCQRLGNGAITDTSDGEFSVAVAPMPPGTGWTELAPAVWYAEVPDHSGRATRRVVAEGDQGFVWMFENHILPLATGSIGLAHAVPDERYARALRGMYADIYAFSLDRYESLVGGEARTPDRIETSGICISYVKASARATTAQPGAKANARAKSCFGHSYVGAVTYPTSNPDGWFFKISSNVGETISISASVYASPARSHAYADNGEHIATDSYP